MVDHNVPDKLRALILQGGGALGAYEVGAFKALIKKIPEIDAKNQEAGRPLFDIVAGTSIGAINAAILVSHFKEDSSKSWNSASDQKRRVLLKCQLVGAFGCGQSHLDRLVINEDHI